MLCLLDTRAVWSLLLGARLRYEGRRPRWQAAMPTGTQTLPWLDSGSQSSGAGSSEGEAPELPPSVHTRRPAPHCPGILLPRGHRKERRCGLCDSGVKPTKPSAVTSHTTVSRCWQEGNLVQCLKPCILSAFIHSQKKITGGCSLVFPTKQGEKTMFSKSSLYTESDSPLA